ncbi:alpha-ketoglutarate-dependent dioxygenase AlkB [Variovorax sp. E3]|uniref:alpha-ketoglutarate-dependent dioxygenase AlkB n=1 Tax=Variovorax sp. E3 TaxID=1914993 RepID=UPI0018DD61D1|nr:alpha-ketoglutarate-dependent dioxygenase AlkB [Variovorax sp. E3]
MIVLRSDSVVLSEQRFSNRGRWYQVDFSIPANRREAELIAQKFCPEKLRPTLVFEDGDFDILGDGQASVSPERRVLAVRGRIEIAVPAGARIVTQLDVSAFQTWLATASLVHLLPKPPVAPPPSTIPQEHADAPRPATTKDAKVRSTKKKVADEFIRAEIPEGLQIVADFVSSSEERNLLSLIDDSEWDTGMARRVQHYGWRYDYKSKKVDGEAFLGPLPVWAADLGERLFQKGLLNELPDQVIVNEYVGAQGINKHIDCPSCFRGPVITISLNESWEMVFSRRTEAGNDEKYKVLLPRGSAAVLDGAARSIWSHEIPRRPKEQGLLRGRRVSITFRKVNTPT